MIFITIENFGNRHGAERENAQSFDTDAKKKKKIILTGGMYGLELGVDL